jgi:hypothetical protein
MSLDKCHARAQADRSHRAHKSGGTAAKDDHVVFRSGLRISPGGGAYVLKPLRFRSINLLPFE